MEESRRRAYIKAQAAKKKQEAPKVTGQAHPSTKRKPFEKVDHPPKKPKVVAEPTVNETAATGKLPPKLGKGKGLMTGEVPVTKKPPSSFARTPSTQLNRFLQSLRMKIMRTWETMPRRLWGRRVSLVSLRYVSIHFVLSVRFVYSLY